MKSQKPKVSSLRHWYEDIDWADWWEEFITAVNENGTAKYQTVHQFCKAKTKKGTEERRLLWWSIGPLGTTTEFSKYDQFDWENKKEQGFWYNSANSQTLATELKKKANALEKMQEVGHINVSFMTRLEALCKEIDKEYSGRLHLPNLSAKENTLRLNTYMRSLSQIQSMMEQAQLMYGRTQGIDLQRMDQFFAMFGKGMGQAAAQMGFAGSTELENKSSTAMGKILNMVLQKSADRELELPDPEMEDIIKDVHSPSKKKASIN